MPDNLRPFADIPEVGYSKRHPEWLLLLADLHDGHAPILCEIESFTMTRCDTPDAQRGGLSEHLVHNLIAAGIRIGMARRKEGG